MTQYRDVADDLRRRILRAEFRAGEFLPSEHGLASAYGVSRGAIRNALAALRRRGLLLSHPGSGWRVQAGLETQEFAELRSFAQWATTRRLLPGGRVVRQQREAADATDARTLQIRAGEDVLRVMRVRTLDGRPVMVERTTYAPWAAPTVETLPSDVSSVTDAMSAAGIVPASGDHRIDTVTASTEDAELLDVRRSVRLLRVQRVTSAQDGRPIESSDDRYAPDAVTFEVRTSTSAHTVVSRR